MAKIKGLKAKFENHPVFKVPRERTLAAVPGSSKEVWETELVYFPHDRVQRYIQELGFNNVLKRPIEVNIAGATDDNSFYSPATKSLTFGTGGVDDAEDADLIWHEYGQAIQDDQVPGFGASHEAGSMGVGQPACGSYAPRWVARSPSD